mmetsp:Transcript_37398/g.76402  ORF Transcript_37398/g.76402 Transcript_37398/m.76402 type:complete len:166 (+) Transcript_37398:1180-1677(+)
MLIFRFRILTTVPSIIIRFGIWIFIGCFRHSMHFHHVGKATFITSCAISGGKVTTELEAWLGAWVASTAAAASTSTAAATSSSSATSSSKRHGIICYEMTTICSTIQQPIDQAALCALGQGRFCTEVCKDVSCCFEEAPELNCVSDNVEICQGYAPCSVLYPQGS